MKEKDSILSIVFFFLLGYLFFHKPIFVSIAAVILFLSLISKIFTRWLHIAWSYLALFLGKINTTIILSIFFYLILFPLSVLKKIFNFRKYRKDRTGIQSTFIIKNKNYQGDDFEKLW